MDGDYCSFAEGPCPYNNVKDCSKQPVVKHCTALRDANRAAKDGNCHCK